MIWLSVNFDVFIVNLLRLCYEKILLLTSVNLRGDYPSIRQAGNLTTLIHMADQAMFRAKSAGRNCIMLHEVELPLHVEN